MKAWLEQIKLKYSPTIPNIDYNDHESRRNWILYMAKKTNKFPVREIYDTISPHVSKMTINNDLKSLEDEKLIKREKDKKTGKSYVIPLFEDSGESTLNTQQKNRKIILDWGLPVLCIVLIGILITIQYLGL